MSQDAKLLFANEAFYAAFAAKDLDAMVAVWSEREPLYCLHPGWPLLVGREAVLQSWAGILASGGPTIAGEAESAYAEGEVGLVICTERLGNGLLAASNLFRMEEGRWRLFHHQAGPCQAAPERRQERPEVLQ